MKPDQFAAILIDKLEGVKRNQEAQEKLDRKLMEVSFKNFLFQLKMFDNTI